MASIAFKQHLHCQPSLQSHLLLLLNILCKLKKLNGAIIPRLVQIHFQRKMFEPTIWQVFWHRSLSSCTQKPVCSNDKFLIIKYNRWLVLRRHRLPIIIHKLLSFFPSCFTKSVSFPRSPCYLCFFCITNSDKSEI